MSQVHKQSKQLQDQIRKRSSKQGHLQQLTKDKRFGIGVELSKFTSLGVPRQNQPRYHGRFIRGYTMKNKPWFDSSWFNNGLTIMVQPWYSHIYHGCVMVHLPWYSQGSFTMAVPWLYHGRFIRGYTMYHGCTMVSELWLYHG